MFPITSVVLCALLSAAWGVEDLSFPPGFQFGVASASYQVEGAWNVSDKGESIWDRFSHTPNKIKNQDTGDVACDSYHQWKRDVDMLVELGVHFYRFSISWPRLLPNGMTNHISADGTKYYSDLIDALLEKGIEPVITLYHWDLPQKLQDLGGWTNILISDWFADYARVVYSLYADRVSTWITINEPMIICDLPYNTGIFAPGIKIPHVAYHLCAKNIHLAHAKAWRIYDEEFKPKYKGRVSLANNLIWMEAATPEDEPYAELARQHIAGRYSHPIYTKEGGWPPAIEKAVGEFCKQQGYSRPCLPAFSKEEIELVKGTFDFYGFNFYTSRLIRKAKEGENVMPWPIHAPEINAIMEISPDWEKSFVPYFPGNPSGFRKQMVWLKENYGDIPFFITENGYPTPGGLEDKDRIHYYRTHLEQVLLAIKEDGVNVTSYTAWALMDNLEWVEGYRVKFGLYEVDYSSPERTRTPRASASYYRSIIEHHSLNVTDDVILESTSDSPTSTIVPFIIIGALIVLALIIARVFYWLNQRSQVKRKNSYVSCKTDDDYTNNGK